jgi:succinate dehydrogenase/fumarate reductase flavoprotein subunit
MTTWQEIMEKDGQAPVWPYPIRYEQEQEIDTDVLVLGGGIAGCWAAISAARKGVRVTLVEKGDTVRSGCGGPGCDHWCDCPSNPVSKVDPDEWAKRLSSGPYSNGIGRQIQCRENYDTLLEMEQMGGKIRDTDDEYLGAEGRDHETKHMISPRNNPFHETNVVVRVWGTTFKSTLKKECQRLDVKIFDRVMATSLLTEGGVQGNRVVGATGVNNRTGEFMVFKSKATIIAMGGPMAIWYFSTEQSGFNSSNKPRTLTGDGIAMAWKAGAELTIMEGSSMLTAGPGHKLYTGAGDPSHENVPIVDDNGRPVPFIGEPGWGKKSGTTDPRVRTGGGRESIREGIMSGEYALPLYGDYSAMSEIERRATWNLMLGEESTTKNITRTFMEAGFDPSRDLLQGYQFLQGGSLPQWRMVDAGRNRGGPVTDWNLKTTLDGLYAAGQELYAPGDHSFAAATGRYAGRKAADYALQTSEPVISREQVAGEKTRVYAPVKRTSGIEWKELHAGISRAMQYFCSEYKTEAIFNMGLETLNEIEEKFVPRLYALDPHKLLRTLEDLSVLANSQAILHASLARKASSKYLDFNRIDYPEADPPEWNKFITVKLENNKVVTKEMPVGYYGNLKENYEAYNRDYKGVCQG